MITLSVVCLCLASACATVSVKKVPTPTQYVRWTDAMQAKADKMEGLRFYLPRPFVDVFESFPVRTDIYIAHGRVSPDGQYIALLEIAPESDFDKRYLVAGKGIQIPKEYSVVPGQVVEAYRTQGDAGGALVEAFKGLAEGRRGSVPLASRGTDSAEPSSPSSASAPPPQPPTGINQRRSTNDNGAFAYQPLRGNFDLVYLPDFEEQYVVSSKAGLGNAMFEVNLGQGWSLQGFNSLVDNSELNKRIFDLIDTSIKVAKQAATAAMGIPLPNVSAPATGTAFRTEGSAGADKIPGVDVTLKIVVIHYAAKGLYPVIKPRELQERNLSDRGRHYLSWDLFQLLPRPTPATELDPTKLTAAQAPESASGYYTVPRYPYQYVSFNTFRYMSFEVLRPTTGDNPPQKYKFDKTGTEGPEGAARTSELADLLERLFGVRNRPTDGSGATGPDDLSGLIRSITGDSAATVPANAAGTNQPHFRVAADPAPSISDPLTRTLSVTLERHPTLNGPASVPLGAEVELLTQINMTARRRNDLHVLPFTRIDIRNRASLSQPAGAPASIPPASTPTGNPGTPPAGGGTAGTTPGAASSSATTTPSGNAAGGTPTGNASSPTNNPPTNPPATVPPTSPPSATPVAPPGANAGAGGTPASGGTSNPPANPGSGPATSGPSNPGNPPPTSPPGGVNR